MGDSGDNNYSYYNNNSNKTEEETRVSEEVSRVVESVKLLHESAASFISTSSREEDALRQRARALNSTIRTLRPSIANLDSKHSDKVKISSDRMSNLELIRTRRFLRMFLGPINVRATRKDVKLKVKEEYNSFRVLSMLVQDSILMPESWMGWPDRDRTAFLFLFFPSLLLVLRSWIWSGCLPALPVQLYQAWLLFLYTGLALRENILRVNGSDIRPWWIYHHYFAMAMALISLTWEIEREPNCAQKQKGVQLFLQWAIMQGVAMLLQNRYQRQRLYTRIAMGKARIMDVVWGETAGVEGQLWLLAPILFISQGFEAYVGMLLLKAALVGVISEWQVRVITSGILLIIMAVGNFLNTVQILGAKSRFKAKMKKSKSKPELNLGSHTL
ncbi:hypothetical protein RHGRI_027977 [Rhododendron griersonianum]|uniref:TMPIT-like protein n=1 Tax=Rhododendron griersonianum TaxID=479676 RepID=A0AAV6J318_9ERIC|nr:hypothetical protein RHGRI_027977 [Rhododendron griersonianum]